MENKATLPFLGRQAAQAEFVIGLPPALFAARRRRTAQGQARHLPLGGPRAFAAAGAIPVTEHVVIDGNIVAGAGVTSGIDFGLALAAILESEDAACEIQLQIEYDPAPPLDSGSLAKAAPALVDRLRARGRVLSEARKATAARVGKLLGVL
jgi:cyclohexyl-isocyanide hydratase